MLIPASLPSLAPGEGPGPELTRDTGGMINDIAPNQALRLGGVAALAALGLGAGVAVTRHAHRVPASPWWDERVGRSKLRRSDLPVGGAAALLTAVVLRATGQRRAAWAIAALGVGAAAGALGTGFAEPLPQPSS
jgi:hypothetical protein